MSRFDMNDDLSHCDCECECEDRDYDTCDCECDCECTSFKTTGNYIKRKQKRIPGVQVTLPNRAGSKRIPTKTPIKVSIPRANICNSLPSGSRHRALCEPESLNRSYVQKGTINVCVIVLPGAQVGKISSSIPKQVKVDIEAANQIWQHKDNGSTMGIKFNVISCVTLHHQLRGIGGNAQNYPWNQNKIEKILLKHAQEICPKAHIYVYYIKGNSIGPIHSNGAKTNAVTFRNYPIIIMSDGALVNKYILAHELGHFLYLNNALGYKYDPEPYPGDPDHNVHPSNLMYPRSDYWPSPPQRPSITQAQIRKALNARFFKK